MPNQAATKRGLPIPAQLLRETCISGGTGFVPSAFAKVLLAIASEYFLWQMATWMTFTKRLHGQRTICYTGDDMHPDKSYFRVLVILPLSSNAGRMRLNGINRFLSEGYNWEIELVRSETAFTPAVFENATDTTYDGIFVGWFESPEILSLHARLNTPSVLIGDVGEAARTRRIPNSILFHDDARMIVRAAFVHFHAIGRLVSYGFVPTRTKMFWSAEREVAFKEESQRSGMAANVFKGTDLEPWLKSLPKPAGILCAFDDRAVDVLAACRHAKLSVPHDVSVLGVGNDAQICENVKPRLSSIAVDFEEQGYQAARELHAMMLRGRKARERTIAAGTVTIVARASTLREAPSGVLVHRAMSFICANAAKGIRPDDVVRHLRVSRRLLDLRFREVTGSSLQTAIREQRLETVKKLLGETKRSIGEIAILCGYHDANYLKNQFKRRFGISMRDYRRSATSPESGQELSPAK